MNLAFGAGRHEQITAGLPGLPQTLDLKCFAEAVAAGPGTVAAAQCRRSPIPHFRKTLGIQTGDELARQIRPARQAAETAGVLKRQTAVELIKADGAFIDFLFRQFEQMRHLEVNGNSLLRVIVCKRSVTFRTGRYHFLDPLFCNGRHIQPGQSQEILPISGPEQVMAAASFSVEYGGINVEKIQQPQTVHQDVSSSDAEMGLEIGVEIRRTAAEKQSFGVRVRPHIVGKPLPVTDFQIRRCHGPHVGLKKAFVSFAAFMPGPFLHTAHVPDEFREIHSRRAAIPAETAGQT